MIARAILDQDDFARHLRKQIQPEGLIAATLKAFLRTLINQAACEELDGTANFVAFAFARSFHLGLVTFT